MSKPISIPNVPLPKPSNGEPDLGKVYTTTSPLYPQMYFYLHTGQLPGIREYLNIEPREAIKELCAMYNTKESEMLVQEIIDFNSSKRYDNKLVLHLNDHLIIFYHSRSEELLVMHTNNITSEELDKIESVIKKFVKNPSHHSINLLVYDAEFGGFRLEEFSLPETTTDITQHYNNDFVDINEIITRRLSEEKSKGIVLLHGIPGTGKTSYIRYLIRQLSKKLIYIPSTVANRLGDPDFLPFLVKHSGSVVIIEDAEDILEERKGGDNGTISNLLNLGDGLLSDCLHIQIICTFNAPLTRIDRALLRKGRVIANYEFKALSVEKSNNLIHSLNIEHKTDKELTLSEIYYLKDLDFSGGEKRGIGFL